MVVKNTRVEEKITRPIGESVPRIDAQEKVTGAAQFVDDIPFGPGLLYARIKRSPHPHALIKKIDTSKALEMPGVRAIATGDDTPGYLGLYLSDRHIFCRDRVRYVGDPVVGVAAVSEDIAERALDLIEVEYEILPAVLDPEFGASPEAELLHPDMGEYVAAPFVFPQPNTNISNHFKIRKGDFEQAWKKCSAVIERSYRIPHIQHVPIEPHIAVAKADLDGKITLWSSTQSPFAQRNLIAKGLGKTQSDVRVIGPYVGGGFGAKAGVTMEALVVVLAMKTKGIPVKLRLTREEEFYTSFVRQGLVMHIKMGCDETGKLLALENKLYWDGGAYTEYGVNVARAAGFSSTGPYEIENINIDSICVYTNHPVGGPMRGFGHPEIHVGIEQCVEELAQQIGMDSIRFREINCVKEGSILATGGKMHANGLTTCLEKVAKAIDWGMKTAPSGPDKKRGKGLAIMWKAPAMPPNAGSSAWVELAEDGKVNVGIGGQEIGQGTFTIMAQMAAAALGVPVDWVRIAGPVDTKYSPYEWQTVASRLTWSMGNAVAAAARDARRQILELVAEAWNENLEDLDIIDGNVISYKTEETLPIKNIVIYGLPKAGDTGWIGGPIVGRGNFMPTYVTGLNPDTGQGERAAVHYTTGAQAVEVEVDLVTGKVEIIRAVSAFDVGRAINPDSVKAQIEGGMVQGISTALLESLQLKDGFVRNPSLVDYRIATSVDVPYKIDSIIVEIPQDDGPWGARGVGEHSMVPTIPAIANAIYDAVGVRPDSPPYTAEKVFLAMADAGIV